MDRLLARLERTFLGRLATERLMTFVVGGMAVTWLIGYLKGPIVVFTQLILVPDLVPQQPWRLVSWLVLPPLSSIYLVALTLYFSWMIGNALTHEWGALKFNLYYLLGALGIVAAAFLTGTPQTNEYLNVSLFFAFATLFPEYEIRLFFVVPVKVKWLGLLSGAYIAYEFVQSGMSTRVAIAVVLSNYLLFFARHLVALLKGGRLLVRQTARRAEQRPRSDERETVARACAICGANQDDGADIRVCTCEKCGGVPRQLCLEHARSH